MTAFKAKKRTCLENLETLLKGVNDGNTPIHIHYFDAIYYGTPDHIPTGHKHVALVQPVIDPNFGYTTCPTTYIYDFDVYVTVMTKGTLKEATLSNLDVLEATTKAIRADHTLSGTCTSSTIEEIVYGNLGFENRNLIAGSRILLRINLEA